MSELVYDIWEEITSIEHLRTRIILAILASWTLYMVYIGFQFYAAVNPSIYGALFSGDLSVLFTTQAIGIITLGWCPMVLLYEFILYILMIWGITWKHPRIYCGYAGFLYGWSYFIYMYVFNFWGHDDFHFTIIVNSLVFLYFLAYVDLDKRNIVMYTVIGMIIGLFTPQLFLMIDHALGWSLPTPHDFYMPFAQISTK